MNEREKLAYMVGLLDGEGNIRIDLRKDKRGFNQHHARMTIVNTDKRMIDWLLENYGGYMWMRDHSHNPKWKNVYFWIKTIGREHVKLIDDMLEFSIIKHERLVLFKEFLETKSTNGVPITDDAREKRDKIMVELNGLNKRGI